MARVRIYGGISEALEEWRRLGVPEGTFGRGDLTSKRFIFLDDIVRDEALALVQEVKGRGGHGCLCKGERALIAITPVVLEAMLIGGAIPEKVQEMTLAWKRRDREDAPVFEWSGGSLDLSQPRIMGILNVTPDSFSDGGKHFDVEAAVARAEQMRSEGADLIDIGGESTRPGASVIPADEEWARISKVIRRVSEEVGLPVSVDTRRPDVARKALRAGASLVNDVSGLGDEMTMVVRDAGAGAFVMHMRGEPANMQSDTQYVDVVGDTYAFLEKRVGEAVRKGVRWESLAVDPGLGFGKDLEGNL
ncbi:MAG: dihydropteroate synthase, partial [Methanomassiliicoccales archaeon]|nr:dihydropteroate synthase [Methanomassiliicoccales archaeon]